MVERGKRNMKYYNYHCHNMYGNPVSMDVIVSMEDYCKRAIELGHDAFFTTCADDTQRLFYVGYL